MICAAEHTAWVERIHAVFFHQGAPAAGRGRAAHRNAGLAALRGGPPGTPPVPGRAAAGGHRPWTCSPPVEARMDTLRRQVA